jgi:hypothetical protein
LELAGNESDVLIFVAQRMNRMVLIEGHRVTMSDE